MYVQVKVAMLLLTERLSVPELPSEGEYELGGAVIKLEDEIAAEEIEKPAGKMMSMKTGCKFECMWCSIGNQTQENNKSNSYVALNVHACLEFQTCYQVFAGVVIGNNHHGRERG